jgi:hypothetical protein
VELVRLRVDCGLPHLLREAAAHPVAVLRQREPHDLADPELDLTVHEHLVAARKRLRYGTDLVRRDHRGFAPRIEPSSR